MFRFACSTHSDLNRQFEGIVSSIQPQTREMTMNLCDWCVVVVLVLVFVVAAI